MFSSHELDTVERVCSRVVILHKGRVVANDSIDNLRTLMSLPNLEGIFAQLAIEQDTAGIARAIPRVHGGVVPEERRQFRILYRDFLRRIVDLEVLSSHGDVERLLVQFAAMLAAFSSTFLIVFGPKYVTGSDAHARAAIHGDLEFLVATTMAVAGLFSVLAWNTVLPDRRDCLILVCCRSVPARCFSRRSRRWPARWA